MASFTWLCHLILATLISSIVASPASQTFKQRCLAFKPQGQVKNSTLTHLEFVTAGTTLQFPDNHPTCGRAQQAVGKDVCRVALSIPTSYRSSITYELWLPEEWTGRILGTGNGGIDGCVKYEDLAYGSLNGFATFGSNNGKNGTSGADFHGNYDIIDDFSWRSLHTSAETSKKLIKLFYSKDFSKSYYLGCSLGGRMGINSATRFPGDFDGIVAGAPAVDFNNLVSIRANYYTITGNTSSPNFINAAMWGVINAEILKQCDTIDGVADGIIENVNKCKFDVKKIQCSATLTANCLTPAQVKIVENVFKPFTYPDGKLIFPAMQYGSEVRAATGLYAGVPFAYSADWFKYVVYSPSWDPATFNTNDARKNEELNPGHIKTYPSFSEFNTYRSQKSKIITYHGGQDNQITIYNTERFFEKLTSEAKSAKASLNDFYRFFNVPGMNHCNSGPGAWVLGQGGNAAAAGIGFDADTNVLASMVRWVEKGVAPTSITGTKFVDDNVASGVDFLKRHCMYPQRSNFTGGDPKSLSSWKCA